MKFNLEDEVEMLPHSKKKTEQKEESEQGGDVAQAIETLKSAAKKEGRSIEDLIREHDHGSEESEAESDEEEKEEMQSGEEEQKEPSEDKTKKLALYVAQMKAKRE